MPKPAPTEAFAEEVPASPTKVLFTRPFGYIDADGNHRNWPAGFVERNPNEIANLIERGAPLEFVEG